MRRARRIRAEERGYRVLGICAGGAAVGLIAAVVGTQTLVATQLGCPEQAFETGYGPSGRVCDGHFYRGAFLSVAVLGTLAGTVLVAVLVSRGRRWQTLVRWGGAIASLVLGCLAAMRFGAFVDTCDPDAGSCPPGPGTAWPFVLSWATLAAAGLAASERLARRVPTARVAAGAPSRPDGGRTCGRSPG